MLPIITSLKNLIKTKSYHIDHPFFRLHSHVTASLLLGFCLVVTAKVVFSDTIDCKGRTDKRDNYYDQMCFALGTFTRYRTADSKQQEYVSTNNYTAPFVPKLDPTARYFMSGMMAETQTANKILWHTSYQYMPIILFIQAAFFYIPHYIWKVWENGIVSSVCKRLYDNRFSAADHFEANYDIVFYLQSCFKLNKSLVFRYHFCHVLLLLNLIAQVIVLDQLFNKQFMFYGYVVFNYLFIDQNIYGMRGKASMESPAATNVLNNPMDFVFPKLTACRIEMPASAGLDINQQELLCVLPLNILHDKFYLLLWFWFVFLAVLTVAQIVCDLLYTSLPAFRRYLFTRRYGNCLWDASHSKGSTSLPDLFILDLIGSNTDKFAFSALLHKLNKEDWTASPSENHSVV